MCQNIYKPLLNEQKYKCCNYKNSKGRGYATRAQLCILEKRTEEVVGFSDFVDLDLWKTHKPKYR